MPRAVVGQVFDALGDYANGWRGRSGVGGPEPAVLQSCGVPNPVP